MKLTAAQILDGYQGLVQTSTAELPVLVAYKIALTLRALKHEVEPLEEARKALLRRHAKKDANGRPIVEDDEYQLDDRPAFEDELKTLRDREIEIDLNPIDLKEFGGEAKFNPVALMLVLEAGLVTKKD